MKTKFQIKQPRLFTTVSEEVFMDASPFIFESSIRIFVFYRQKLSVEAERIAVKISKSTFPQNDKDSADVLRDFVSAHVTYVTGTSLQGCQRPPPSEGQIRISSSQIGSSRSQGFFRQKDNQKYEKIAHSTRMLKWKVTSSDGTKFP